MRLQRALSFATAILILRPCYSAAKDLVISGDLLKVTPTAISIRLDDGRLIDALLPAASKWSGTVLAANYYVGDQVQITYRSIEPVYDQEAGRYRYLELKAFRFIRRPTPDELSTVLASQACGESGNLLKRPGAVGPSNQTALAAVDSGGQEKPEAEPDKLLAVARSVNLEYASQLPNFVVDETATRYTSSTIPPQWHYFDTITSELTFKGLTEVRQHITRNAAMWNHPFHMLPGMLWSLGFGGYLKPIFTPRCETSFDFAAKATIHAREVSVYRFRTVTVGCLLSYWFEYQRCYAGQSGQIFIDSSDGRVMQLDSKADALPSQFPITQAENEVSWDYVDIGGVKRFLPVSTDIMYRNQKGTLWWVRLEFKNHRHFEAKSEITFH